MIFSLADLNITLGTTLQINPSGTLPLKNKKFDGKLVICNLQPTKYDKKADLVISTYVDHIMEKVCKRLGVELPEYAADRDPTKQIGGDTDWIIQPNLIKKLNDQYKEKLKTAKKRKSDGPMNEDLDRKKVKIGAKKEENTDES